MSEIKALEKLRKSSHIDDNKGMFEDGETVQIYHYNEQPDDPNTINFGEQWRKIADEIEIEVDERFIELPVDADGVPIHMGDTVEGELLDGSTVRGTVSAFHLYDDEPDSVYIHVDVSGGVWTVKELRITRCRHVKPRTLEDVLRDVWNEALDYAKSDIWRNPDEVFAERSDEIREIMKGDKCKGTPKAKGANCSGEELYEYETSCGTQHVWYPDSLPNCCPTCGKEVKGV